MVGLTIYPHLATSSKALAAVLTVVRFRKALPVFGFSGTLARLRESHPLPYTVIRGYLAVTRGIT